MNSMVCIAAAESNEMNVCSVNTSGWRTHKRFYFHTKVVFFPSSLQASPHLKAVNKRFWAVWHLQHGSCKNASHIDITCKITDFELRDAFRAHANRYLCECRASNFSDTIHVLHCFAETCVFQPGTEPTTIGQMAPGFVTEQWNCLPVVVCPNLLF